MESATTRAWEATPDPTPRVRTGRASLVAAFGLVASTPLATWWSVGANPGGMSAVDPGRGPVPLDEHDHLISPPTTDAGLGQAVGRMAVVVAVIAVVVLVAARRAGGLDRRWVPPLGALVLAGCLVGAGGRVVTAAVIGANIGGGLVILFGLPVVVALVIGAVVWAVDLLRAPVLRSPAGSGATSAGRP